MSAKQVNKTLSNGPTPPRKRPQKIFGIMTKRRWFGVVVFLSAMLWSYTAGPPLPDSIICNRYFLDGTSYDYSTVAFEGNLALIDSIFKRGFWPHVFTWQIGAYFGWTEGPIWNSKRGKLIFSDVIQNNIFSWSPINGIQIEIENAGQCTENQVNDLYEPGSNGLVEHPTDPDTIFMAQHAQRRIVSYNLETKHHTVIADTFNGKPLNSPNDLVIGPNKQYLYFTDPSYGFRKRSDDNDPNLDNANKRSEIGFNGVYRVKLDGKGSVELLDKSIKVPNGIAFSSSYRKLYVSDCIQGEFRLNVFDVDATTGKITLDKLWDEAWVLRNGQGINTLKGGVGCVDGLAMVNDEYLVSTCPGGKLCIVNQQRGDLEALIKLPDKTALSNVAVGEDRHLYVTGNHTVWQIRLQPL
eukprot:509865_1